MNDFEPGDTMVEAFRRANPVPVGSTEGRRSQPSAHALFARVIEQQPRRVRRVRRPVLVIAIAIIVLALVIAAFATTRRQQSSQPLNVVCYSAASLDAPRVLVSDNGDPASLCKQLWIAGRLGSGAVPDFDVCVDAKGVPSVFPGESGSVCSQLGLAEDSGNGGNTLSFSDDIATKMRAQCLAANAARTVVSNDLAQYKMKGWRITGGSGSFPKALPCASVFIDVPTRTVKLVPIGTEFITPPLTGGS